MAFLPYQTPETPITTVTQQILFESDSDSNMVHEPFFLVSHNPIESTMWKRSHWSDGSRFPDRSHYSSVSQCE